MTKNEYNGWYNYETWVVNLWMTQDEGSSDYFDELASQYDDVNDLADAIKEYHEDLIEQAGIENGFMADLLGGAMSEVNWREIAEHYEDRLNGAEDEEEEEEEA